MNLLFDSCFPSVVPLLSRGWIVPVGGATPDRLKMGARRKNLTFRRDGVIIRVMNAMNDIAKQPPMRPAPNAAAVSSIGSGRRGNGGKSYAVWGAEIGSWTAKQAQIVSDKMKNGATTLYKYCSVSQAKGMLRDGAVSLKPAFDFNDPFEMMFRIQWPNDDELRECIEREFPHRRKRERDAICEDALAYQRKFGGGVSPQGKQALLHNAGASCFSETPEGILMWSHYADDHKGVCIGFPIQSLMESFAAKPVNSFGECVLLAVRYQDAIPVWDMRRGDALGEVAAIKASCWAYEREWRIFALNAANEKQELLRESFGQIIFGGRMDENEKAELARFARGRNPDIEILNAEISEEEYKVAISAGMR